MNGPIQTSKWTVKAARRAGEGSTTDHTESHGRKRPGNRSADVAEARRSEDEPGPTNREKLSHSQTQMKPLSKKYKKSKLSRLIQPASLGVNLRTNHVMVRAIYSITASQ